MTRHAPVINHPLWTAEHAGRLALRVRRTQVRHGAPALHHPAG